MSLGQLRHRVTVQRRAVTRAGGIGVEAWPALYARVPAQVEGRQERQEQVVDGVVRTHTVRSYTVRTRYLPDITTADRMLYHHPEGDRVLQILGLLDEGERRAWLVCECVEVGS